MGLSVSCVLMATDLTYEDLRGAFEAPDGPDLCDVIAHATDAAGWASFLDLIRRRYPHRVEFRDLEGPIPPGWSPEWGTGREAPIGDLSFSAGELEFRAYLNGPERLEMDVPRRKVRAGAFDALLDLVRDVGSATGRDVFLSEEMRDSEAFAVYETDRRRLRRPRRGEGSNGRLARRLMGEAARILGPLSLLKPEAARVRHERPVMPEALVRDVLEDFKGLLASERELVLQDELTVEERDRLDGWWTLLATLEMRREEGRTDADLAHLERRLLETL